MAIAQFTEPTVALKANMPDYSPLAFDTFYKNSRNAPIANISTIMDGIPWSVDYFNQRLKKDQSAQFLDSSLSPTIQQYNAISNLTLHVQDPLSSDIDDNNKARVHGSALVHKSVRPIVGDVFTAEVLGGELGLFKVVDVKQTGYNKDADTLVEYELHKYLEKGDKTIKALDEKSNKRFFYETDQLDKGNVPVVAMKDHHDRIHLVDYLDSLKKDYMRDFYDANTETVTIPNKNFGILYDDYLVRFVKTIYNKIGNTPRSSKVTRYNVRDSDISVTTIFSALEDRTRLFTDAITTDIDVIRKEEYVGRNTHASNLIKYSPLKFIAKTRDVKYKGHYLDYKGFLAGNVLGQSLETEMFQKSNALVKPIITPEGLRWIPINDILDTKVYPRIKYPGMKVKSLERVIIANVTWINSTPGDIIVPHSITDKTMDLLGFRRATIRGNHEIHADIYPTAYAGYVIDPLQIFRINGALWKNTSDKPITLPTELTDDDRLIKLGLSKEFLTIAPNKIIVIDAKEWKNNTSGILTLPETPTTASMRLAGFMINNPNGVLIPRAAEGVTYSIESDEYLHLPDGTTVQNTTATAIDYTPSAALPAGLTIHNEATVVRVVGDTVKPNEVVRIKDVSYVNLREEDIIIASDVYADLLDAGLTPEVKVYQPEKAIQTVVVNPNEKKTIQNITYQNVTLQPITVNINLPKEDIVALGLIEVIKPIVAVPGLIVKPNQVVTYDHIDFVNNTPVDITLPNPIREDELLTIGLTKVNADTNKIELVKPVFLDSGYYIFSKDFYNSNKNKMSILERMVFTYMKNKPIKITDIMNIYKSYKTWSSLQKLYYTPVVLLLTDYLLDTYHSPWSYNYD